MPNQPKPDNRPHMIRVPNDLWQQAKARSEQRGETISDAIRAFLRRYVHRGAA